MLYLFPNEPISVALVALIVSILSTPCKKPFLSFFWLYCFFKFIIIILLFCFDCLFSFFSLLSFCFLFSYLVFYQFHFVWPLIIKCYSLFTLCLNGCRAVCSHFLLLYWCSFCWLGYLPSSSFQFLTSSASSIQFLDWQSSISAGYL